MIQARVAALAAGLRSSLLLQPGDVVALAMRPSDTFLESLLAITACGCIAALLNLRWSVAEAAEAVQNSKARLILADEVGRQLLQPCATSVQLIHTDLPAGDAHLYSCEKMIRQHRGTPYRLSLPQNGAAVICFTSGSTGRSKGAVLSHIAFHCQALAKVVEVGYDRSDTYLHCAPLYHVGGLSSALAYLMLGAKQVFQPQYSAATACALIEDHQVSAFIAVPAIINDIIAHLRSTSTTSQPPAMSCVKRILLGGGSMSVSQLKPVRTAFPNAALTAAYGMTEACSSMTFQPVCLEPGVHAHSQQQPQAWGTCVGKPPPGIEVAARATQATAEHLSVGEIVTRGPHTMLGYIGEQQCSQVDEDGWLRTGDLGWMDSERRLWLVGRLKDVIRSGSENVHAAEVERILLQHPAIEAVAVVGLPHRRWGEQVAALLQLSPSADWATKEEHQEKAQQSAAEMIESQSAPYAFMLDLSILRSHCLAAGLSRYKLPLLAFGSHDALPTNSAGKHIKPAVKALLLQHMSHKGDVLSKL